MASENPYVQLFGPKLGWEDTIGVNTDEHLDEGCVVAVYFYKGDSDDMREQLVETYKHLRSVGKQFKVIVAPTAAGPAKHYEIFQSLEWECVHKVHLQRLLDKYRIWGAHPHIILMQNGNVITKRVAKLIVSDPKGKGFPWYNQIHRLKLNRMDAVHTERSRGMGFIADYEYDQYIPDDRLDENLKKERAAHGITEEDDMDPYFADKHCQLCYAPPSKRSGRCLTCSSIGFIYNHNHDDDEEEEDEDEDNNDDDLLDYDYDDDEKSDCDNNEFSDDAQPSTDSIESTNHDIPIADLPETLESIDISNEQNIDSPPSIQSIQYFNPILRILLIGTCDPDSSLSLIRQNYIVLRNIFDHLRAYWWTRINRSKVGASLVGRVRFPSPSGININMMPFVMGKADSIPLKYRKYHALLEACPLSRDEWGKIGYLTIHESEITSDGTSQRRGGLHTETPGSRKRMFAEGCGGEFVETEGSSNLTLAWGRGYLDMDDEVRAYQGGIFMASTVSNSCQVWNAQVANPEEDVGNLGDIEHLRGALDEGYKLQAGDLVWMTDSTPHESLPLPKGTFRQYFRVVTSEISAWYAKHSTPNELGVTPPDYVEIVDVDKFDGK